MSYVLDEAVKVYSCPLQAVPRGKTDSDSWKKKSQSKRVLPLKTCPGDRPQAKFYYKNIYTHSFRVKQTNWENHYVLNVV